MTQSQTPSRPLSPDQTAAVMAELKAILSSESFSGSGRCQHFLEFVVTRTLSGDQDILTERFIGVELFGRAVDYETATDAIVRVRANDVRRRLAQYYSSRQPVSAVRIDFAAGRYIPEFQWNAAEVAEKPLSIPGSPLPTAAASAEAAKLLSIEPQEQLKATTEKQQAWARLTFGKRGLGALCASLVLVAAIVAGLLQWQHKSDFDLFWAPVFEAHSAPVLVLPTTNTFQLAPGAEQKFGQYRSGAAASFASGELQELHNWHMSLPVLQGTLSVAMALDRHGEPPLVRVGTELKPDELRGHPVITIGSFSNPWTKENVSGLRFTFDRGSSDKGTPFLRDSHDPRRTWSLTSIFPEPQTKDYAIVTRTFDPVTHAPFVSLAGLHTFGNQIAGEFVSKESSWKEVASRAPAHWETMNLQIVLESDIVGTTPSAPRIVDVYFWK